MNAPIMPMPSVLLCVTLLCIAAPAAAQLDGAFTLRRNERDDRLNLNLQSAEGRSNYGRNFDRAEFTNVSQDGERITFTLRRAPGTFTFEGRGSMDRASGWYGFAPNVEFRREAERLGFRDVDDRALFVFAMDDLTIARIKQLQGLVADTLDTEQLVRLINHGAGVRYVQAMTDAGFRKLSSDEYRRARDHGVSAEFAREMADLGMPLPLADLIRSRDHGVTPEYVRAMRAAGITVDHDELVRAKDHGVSAEFIKRMGGLGYAGLPLRDYVRFRDHGVTPDYVESLRDAGLSKLAADDLVRLRNHGISTSYVRQMREVLKDAPTVDEIIRLRNRGHRLP